MDIPHKEFFTSRGFEIECLGPGMAAWAKYSTDKQNCIIIDAMEGEKYGKEGPHHLPLDHFRIGMYYGVDAPPPVAMIMFPYDRDYDVAVKMELISTVIEKLTEKLNAKKYTADGIRIPNAS